MNKTEFKKRKKIMHDLPAAKVHPIDRVPIDSVHLHPPLTINPFANIFHEAETCGRRT